MNPSLLLLSGTTTEDLRARCETVLDSLEDPVNHHGSLDDLQARLAVVTPGPHRVAVVAATADQTCGVLRRVIDLLPDLTDDPTDRSLW